MATSLFSVAPCRCFPEARHYRIGSNVPSLGGLEVIFWSAETAKKHRYFGIAWIYPLGPRMQSWRIKV